MSKLLTEVLLVCIYSHGTVMAQVVWNYFVLTDLQETDGNMKRYVKTRGPGRWKWRVTKK